jgi:hypothetical protein
MMLGFCVYLDIVNVDRDTDQVYIGNDLVFL